MSWWKPKKTNSRRFRESVAIKNTRNETRHQVYQRICLVSSVRQVGAKTRCSCALNHWKISSWTCKRERNRKFDDLGEGLTLLKAIFYRCLKRFFQAVFTLKFFFHFKLLKDLFTFAFTWINLFNENQKTLWKPHQSGIGVYFFFVFHKFDLPNLCSPPILRLIHTFQKSTRAGGRREAKSRAAQNFGVPVNNWINALLKITDLHWTVQKT